MDKIDIRFEGANGFERGKITTENIDLPIVENEHNIPILDITGLLDEEKMKKRLKYRKETNLWELGLDYIDTSMIPDTTISHSLKIPNHRIYHFIFSYPLCKVDRVREMTEKLNNRHEGKKISFEIGYEESELISHPPDAFIEPIKFLNEIDCWKVAYFDGQYDAEEMMINATVNLIPSEKIVYYI